MAKKAVLIYILRARPKREKTSEGEKNRKRKKHYVMMTFMPLKLPSGHKFFLHGLDSFEYEETLIIIYF